MLLKLWHIVQPKIDQLPHLPKTNNFDDPLKTAATVNGCSTGWHTAKH
jgi:hypothetical protein